MFFLPFFDYRKFIPLIIGILISSYVKANLDSRPKLFLYQSTLPQTLITTERELKKHVIDVILATQKYEVVFSKIPKILTKAKVPQKIIKYKFRTDGEFTYRIELFLIDADVIQIIKNSSYNKVHRDELLREFRLRLYEFILGRKLKKEEKEEFENISLTKINRFKSRPVNNRFSQKSIPDHNSNNLSEVKQDKNKTQSQNSDSNKPHKEKSLWDLLVDQDSDRPWEKEKEVKTKENSKKDKIGRGNSIEPNPFRAWAKVSQGDQQRDSLVSNQVHLAYKYVDRQVDVKDIIDLKNDFFSPIGLSFEWIYFFPRHVSPFLFRSTLELDYSTNTEPISMDGHSLFRFGFGYRLNYWYLPSLYYEQSNLNYANLNVIGDEIEPNTHQVKWLNLEQAFNGNQLYFSIHYALTIGATKNKDQREDAAPQGRRLAFNLRYFTMQRFFKQRFWYDIEYRREDFTRDMIDQTMAISKQEVSLRFGIYL